MTEVAEVRFLFRSWSVAPEGPIMEILTKPHTHHWLIDEPTGTFSAGVCISCGEHRLFRNWDKDHDWVTNTEAKIGC